MLFFTLVALFIASFCSVAAHSFDVLITTTVYNTHYVCPCLTNTTSMISSQTSPSRPWLEDTSSTRPTGLGESTKSDWQGGSSTTFPTTKSDTTNSPSTTYPTPTSSMTQPYTSKSFSITSLTTASSTTTSHTTESSATTSSTASKFTTTSEATISTSTSSTWTISSTATSEATSSTTSTTASTSTTTAASASSVTTSSTIWPRSSSSTISLTTTTSAWPTTSSTSLSTITSSSPTTTMTSSCSTPTKFYLSISDSNGQYTDQELGLVSSNGVHPNAQIDANPTVFTLDSAGMLTAVDGPFAGYSAQQDSGEIPYGALYFASDLDCYIPVICSIVQPDLTQCVYNLHCSVQGQSAFSHCLGDLNEYESGTGLSLGSTNALGCTVVNVAVVSPPTSP